MWHLTFCYLYDISILYICYLLWLTSLCADKRVISLENGLIWLRNEKQQLKACMIILSESVGKGNKKEVFSGYIKTRINSTPAWLFELKDILFCLRIYVCCWKFGKYLQYLPMLTLEYWFLCIYVAIFHVPTMLYIYTKKIVADNYLMRNLSFHCKKKKIIKKDNWKLQTLNL